MGLPDVGEGGGEVNDEGTAEEGRAGVGCHVEEYVLLCRFLYFKGWIEKRR